MFFNKLFTNLYTKTPFSKFLLPKTLNETLVANVHNLQNYRPQKHTGPAVKPIWRHFKVRYYFPVASEIHRIRKFGWATRMSTPTGRRLIMERIVKGKTNLTH